MPLSCIFYIIRTQEENPKCGDVIGNPTKESHVLGSKVENIDINDKTANRTRSSAGRPAALCLF